MSGAAAPILPTPLSNEHGALLSRLVHGLDSSGLWWISGYAAGLAQAHATPQLEVVPGGSAAVGVAQGQRKLSVLYGSQTGNARREAEKIAAAVEAAGSVVRLARLDSYPLRELADEKLLYLVISTQGEGDPPDDSIGFAEFLFGRRAPRLAGLQYAVLGLGDSSYVNFCGTAKKIDARLAELGAVRVLDPGFTDLDIEAVAGPWRERALDKSRELLERADPATAAPLATVTPLRPVPSWGLENPYPAEVFVNQRISGREYKAAGFRVYGAQDKDVRHIELSLEGSGLSYEPGDALGIQHRNPPALIDWTLQATGLDRDAAVTLGGKTLPLAEWLATERELTRLSRPFLAALAECAGDAELNHLLEPDAPGFAALLADHQVIDALRRWPAEWTPATLVAALRPQTRRLYSIASSRKRVGEEVHLCVDVVNFEAHGHAHLGAASGFLAALEDGARVPVYVETNERFRLPTDPSRDLIMIGPGTGVAPFRAFVQERAEIGASGRSWLFFGARQFSSGFLYQTEWQDALAKGELSRLDLAFSRDQAERIHVQQRLREQGRALHDWLQNGAHLYVCGALAMSRDVHAALLDVLCEHGGGDADRAVEYLSTLQREGRYARDVY